MGSGTTDLCHTGRFVESIWPYSKWPIVGHYVTPIQDDPARPGGLAPTTRGQSSRLITQRLINFIRFTLTRAKTQRFGSLKLNWGQSRSSSNPIVDSLR